MKERFVSKCVKLSVSENVRGQYLSLTGLYDKPQTVADVVLTDRTVREARE